MTATHTALLDAPHLPSAVRRVHIFPQMQNKALLSLGQFCDNDYVVKLTKTTIAIEHLNDPTMSLHGRRDVTTGMWTINLEYKSLQPATTNHPL